METSWLFEVSWEVCNKVGGIHTVISSKAAQAVSQFGERYVAMGPLLKSNPGFEPCDPPESIVPALERLAAKHVEVSVGRWDIPGRPWAMLIGFRDVFKDPDKLLFQLWNDYGVDSMAGAWDYIEPVLFSTASAMAIKEIGDDMEGVADVYAHFHEWMSGAGVLYLKKHAPGVSTVLTTHATMLGRSMSGSGVDIYAALEEIEPTQEAKAFGVSAKHSMESVSAREADCFTTVSNITRREASNLLGTNPAVVTTNGFNLEALPSRSTWPKSGGLRAGSLWIWQSGSLSASWTRTRPCWWPQAAGTSFTTRASTCCLTASRTSTASLPRRSPTPRWWPSCS